MYELSVVQFIISSVAVPMLGWIIMETRSAKKSAQDAAEKVQTQNSRIGKLEQWAIGHEQLDNERTVGLHKCLDRIQEAIGRSHITNGVGT